MSGFASSIEKVFSTLISLGSVLVSLYMNGVREVTRVALLLSRA
jgi:hypothetical protein